jgi:uncharacterized damage-inducible protein DinB
MAPIMPPLPLDALRELTRHMEWADASMLRALQAHAPAAEDARVRSLLMHLHGVQRWFLALWHSQPLPATPASGAADLPALRGAVETYYRELEAALSAFDAEALERPIVTPGLESYEQKIGRRFDRPTLAETMLQVVMHSTYHRGQLAARLRELGGEPPLVDYIAWIWFGRPAPDWSTTA